MHVSTLNFQERVCANWLKFQIPTYYSHGKGVKSFCEYRKHVSGKGVLCTRITLLVLNQLRHVISSREWIGWSSDVYCSWSSIYIGTDYCIERARWMSFFLLLVSRDKLKGLDELDQGILQPLTIRSDGGPQFRGEFSCFCLEKGIKHNHTIRVQAA